MNEVANCVVSGNYHLTYKEGERVKRLKNRQLTIIVIFYVTSILQIECLHSLLRFIIKYIEEIEKCLCSPQKKFLMATRSDKLNKIAGRKIKFPTL